jgi:YceI-like domain
VLQPRQWIPSDDTENVFLAPFDTPDRPAASSVTASIPVASVDVTNDRLRSRLVDADLLGGKDHPTITFRSTRVEVVDLAHWKVTGDLTIHGVARSVLLDRHYLGQATHPFAKKIAAGSGQRQRSIAATSASPGMPRWTRAARISASAWGSRSRSWPVSSEQEHRAPLRLLLLARV